MVKKTTVLLVIALLFLSAPAGAWWYINKDITNTGSTAAYDVKVEISGSHVIDWHYDGYSTGRFYSFNWGLAGSNTTLHWQKFDDDGVPPPGDIDVIDPGQTIHIGWGTKKGGWDIVDMYWTDQSGNPITGKLYNITTKRTYEFSTKKVGLIFRNIFSGGPTLTVSNVMYASLSDSIALVNLNAQNATLAAALQSVPGSPIQIAPGQSQTLWIPVPIIGDPWVVVRYEVTGAGSVGQIVDYVEFPAPTDIPTLSEWALIVFSVLLLAMMTYYVIRRRKVAHSGAF